MTAEAIAAPPASPGRIFGAFAVAWRPLLFASALFAASTTARAQITADDFQRQNGPDKPASAVAPAAAIGSPPTAAVAGPETSSADFTRGQQDRAQWETWSRSLDGDYRQGAAFWAANRSMSHHAGCDGASISGVTPAWTAGCMAAMQRLTPSDALRHASADYRRGWNSIPSVPGGDNAGVPLADQSQNAFNNPPQDPPSSNQAVAAPPPAPVTQSSPQAAAPSVNGWAILLVVLVVALAGFVLAQLSWVIPLYNRLVGLRQNANRAFADMDVLLKQRRDLIPNIVETVKGYASHENATLRSVISLRSVAAGSGATNEKMAAESSLSSELGKVFALAEAYPDLKANTTFLTQQNMLSGIENRISSTRMGYNAVISEYNSSVQRFPAILIAGALGFHSREFFDVGAEARSELNSSRAVQSLTQSLTA